MSYIKINGEDTKYYVSIMPFTTQHGYNAIKFIGGDIPETDKGFMLYDDNDKIISDFTEYIYLYKPNEYSVEEDEIVYPQWTNNPIEPSFVDVLNKRVNKLNVEVNDITPYEETKTIYYGESEKVFYGIPQGNISIFFDNYNGEYTVNKIADRVIISFPNRLENMTNVTIMVQG